jgi:hypothetical protein
LAGRALTKGVEPLARLISQERRQAEATDKGHALVAILLGKAAFNLQGLIPWAPTGITTPPAPVHFGGETFYYYGPGAAASRIRISTFSIFAAKMLQLIFDGPYRGDSNSPDEPTQQIEKKMLASFRTFNPTSTQPKL